MATHTADIVISASTHKVFDALTNPEYVRLWQYNKIVSTDWKAGSEIKFITETDGNALEQWGTILAVRPNELIKYNLFTPWPNLEDDIENYCVTSYELTDNNGQTHLKIIQEDNRPNGFTPISLEPILITLKKIIEAN